MKLLFDQNISHRIVPMLADVYVDVAHVRDFALNVAQDRTIWDFAEKGGWVIVSKDGDFHQMSLLYGPPPKIVWLRVGNQTTLQLAGLVRSRAAEISEFITSEAAILILGGA